MIQGFDDDYVLGVLAWIQGCLGLEAWTNGKFEASLAKLAKDVSYGLMIDENDAYVMNDVFAMKVEQLLAFMAWNVIACLYGMNVIACLHDMVDKLAFMAWLLACLCGMDGKVSEIGSKASDEVYLSFGRHLEEIHMTLAYLEKKQTRLRTYTNISQDYVLSSWRQRHKIHVTPP
ncbi:hypothetical protein Tco_0737265 [Tanacetum coccineum]